MDINLGHFEILTLRWSFQLMGTDCLPHLELLIEKLSSGRFHWTTDNKSFLVDHERHSRRQHDFLKLDSQQHQTIAFVKDANMKPFLLIWIIKKKQSERDTVSKSHSEVVRTHKRKTRDSLQSASWFVLASAAEVPMMMLTVWADSYTHVQGLPPWPTRKEGTNR